MFRLKINLFYVLIKQILKITYDFFFMMFKIDSADIDLITTKK